MMITLQEAAVSGRLAPVDGQINPGQIVHLVGPNGAGKSTLLQRIAGLLEGPGKIYLQGRLLSDFTPQRLARSRAWLAQSQPVPAAMPLFHYLTLHLFAQKNSADEAILAILQPLGLLDKLDRPLSRLSGGEWQRARLAAVLLQIDRACNSQGKLLLLDEPTTGLDIAQQKKLDELILRLTRQGIAVVMSSHDLNHSLHQADKVWLMKQGTVIAQGEAEAVLCTESLASLYGINFRLLDLEGQLYLSAI